MTTTHTSAVSQQGDGTAFAAGSSPFAVVALDIGGTKIGGAVVRYRDRSSAPEVVGRRTVPTEAKRGGAAVTDTVCAFARELVEEAGGVGFLGRHTVNLLSGEAAGDAPADRHEIKVVSGPVQMDAVR